MRQHCCTHQRAILRESNRIVARVHTYSLDKPSQTCIVLEAPSQRLLFALSLHSLVATSEEQQQHWMPAQKLTRPLTPRCCFDALGQVFQLEHINSPLAATQVSNEQPSSLASEYAIASIISRTSQSRAKFDSRSQSTFCEALATCSMLLIHSRFPVPSLDDVLQSPCVKGTICRGSSHS